MTVFGTNYSRYYDLLYSDKDYEGESQYIHKLIQQYDPGAKTILDLGCGTGRHDACLAGIGYKVHGVDISADMLSVAQKCANGDSLRFTQGDISSIRLGEEFDVVIALFHVMSYQTSNNDLLGAFSTAYEHLLPGGVFIFDCWYGPAVLTDRPVVRVKRLENEQIQVNRIAKPLMYPNENLVDVNYHMFIRDKSSGQIEEMAEIHKMRYLFKPEIELMLGQTGFDMLGQFEFLTGGLPGYDTWSVCFVVRK
jgi:SAM-dependent methyltransferase